MQALLVVDARPIAWIQHLNKPTECRAFDPEATGARYATANG